MNESRRGNIDMGCKPVAVDIERLTKNNQNYRTALWTGEYLQVTLMCIPVGGDIGAEVHCDTDQFLCVESGCALAVTGQCRNQMNCSRKVTNSVYAPPHHPFGTVQRTKKDAQCAGR